MIKITCVRFRGETVAHTHISHVGGPAGGGWLMPTSQAMRTIESGTNEFYMAGEDGSRVKIEIEQGPRRKHLRARRGDVWCDDLLNLPVCES